VGGRGRRELWMAEEEGQVDLKTRIGRCGVPKRNLKLCAHREAGRKTPERANGAQCKRVITGG